MKQNTEIVIVDPLNKSNNVAKSTQQYNNVKMAFRISFYSAHESCDCSCHYKEEFSKFSENEHCLLKRMFKAVRRFQKIQESDDD